MEKISRPILWFLAVLVCVVGLAMTYAPRAAAQQPKVIGNAFSNTPLRFDVSPPLGSLVSLAPAANSSHDPHTPRKPKLHGSAPASPSKSAAAPILIGAQVTATQGLGFAGVDEIGDALDCPILIPGHHHYVPPDTNAAVGDSQIVQWVNICYAVFDKSTGAVIAGPFLGTNFWSGFGGPCEANNDGDPIIQWDKVNHRWLAAQNVFNSATGLNPPYYTCVAVSQTADATGSYFRYQFPQPGFPDYPKWGKKGNVYYQTQNNFGNDDGFEGVTVCAYQANLMLKGNSKAKQVCIVDDSNGTLFDDSMLPADDDSPGPSNAEVLLGAIDNFLPGDTHVYEYVFTVDFGKPGNSTLAGIDGSMPISVPAFELALCVQGGALTTNCVPQPTAGPHTDTLDTLGDRLMYRLAHFSGSNGIQHYVVTHSVNDSSGAVGQRWYEFRAKGLGSTSLYLYQTGQTPADGEYRWMGSAAMDKAGNIALGYSRSSAASGDYPSIYYAGQTAGDPLGTTESEVLIKQGGGSQINSVDRWGDYSSMALDGADSCTFWYTTEYYPRDATRAWATWIASLKFPNCQ